MQIYPICARHDNYIWAIVKDDKAIIIDPANSETVIEFLTDKKLTLSAILVTHGCHDHKDGVAPLWEVFPDIKVFAHTGHNVRHSDSVDEGDSITIDDLSFKVWRTAGHTATHLSYLLEYDNQCHVFCGDTLFSGGCGRVYAETTMDALFASLSRFKTLPDEAIFYPAHEYTLSNLTFALRVCGVDVKENITQTIESLKDKTISLPTTLAHEKNINVFLQTDNQHMINNLANMGLLVDTDELSVFKALRELKNRG